MAAANADLCQEQLLSVENTFIHFRNLDEAADARVLRRSSSAPALMQSETPSEEEDAEAPASTEDACIEVPQIEEEATVGESFSMMDKMLAHSLGSCKPCGYYYFKRDGCRMGDSCKFCHLCSEDDVKNRKRSTKKEARASKRSAAVAAKVQSRFAVGSGVLRCQIPIGGRLFAARVSQTDQASKSREQRSQ